jgi:hypothetical protein
MKDDEPTPEEQREAEALARALEGAPSDSAPPPEALEVAALLRHGGGDLDPARARAVADRVRPVVRRPRRRWLLVLAPLAMGAAALVVLPVMRRPTLPRLAALPPPAPALLAAQAQAARGQGQALEALDTQMRAYRQALFAKLREAR